MYLKAKKSLGQNFLIDPEALSDIANSIEITGKHIIEVGPGYGALTEYILSHHPKTLDMVELDTDMVRILDERFMTEQDSSAPLSQEGIGQKSQEMSSPLRNEDVTEGSGGVVPIPRLTLHHEDILTFSPRYEEYSVIANIPYYITSPILFHFLYPLIQRSHQGYGDSGVETVRAKKKTENGGATREGANFSTPETFDTFGHKSMESLSGKGPREMVIMMQKEVGEKILEGRARKPHHSYLSLAMELVCDDIEIIRYVSRRSFDPEPKVDSVVLKFTVRNHRDQLREDALLELWRIAFTHPRKTLMSNLKGSHYDMDLVKNWLRECGYDEKVRAEAVKMEDWGGFFKENL